MKFSRAASRIYLSADKSLAPPGRKKATATKLWLLQATQKKFRMLSVRPGLRGSNDLRVGRKMATFQLFSQSGRAKDVPAPLYIWRFSGVSGVTHSIRNVGIRHRDAAVCPRIFHWLLSPPKLQVSCPLYTLNKKFILFYRSPFSIKPHGSSSSCPGFYALAEASYLSQIVGEFPH